MLETVQPVRHHWPAARNSSADDENQFLETKSVLVQELEIILASVEVSSPNREEVHTLIGNAPSLRYLSEMNEGALRNVGKPVAQDLYRLALDPRPIEGAPGARRIPKGAFASLLGKKTKDRRTSHHRR